MLYKALLLSAVCLALSHIHNFALNKVTVEVWALVCGQEQASKMKTTWEMCTVRLSPDSLPWHGPLQFQGAMLMLHYHPLLFILPRCFGWSMMSSVMVTHVCEHRGEGLNCHLTGQRCLVGHHYVSCEHTIKRGGVKVGGWGGKNLDAHMHVF